LQSKYFSDRLLVPMIALFQLNFVNEYPLIHRPSLLLTWGPVDMGA
jgi:hypothetical protein